MIVLRSNQLRTEAQGFYEHLGYTVTKTQNAFRKNVSPEWISPFRCAGVTKTFGSTVAVDNLDLVVPRGALYGFIGPNGAGKTTTLRMIMSILFPDRGELSVLGSRGHRSERSHRLSSGRARRLSKNEGRGVPHLHGAPERRANDFSPPVRRVAGAVGLADVQDKRCEELSKGMLQKVQLLAAVLHEPDLLILDEPFSGLDPVNMRLLRDLILAEHRRGATILFSTHVMVQAEEMCDHIVMLHKGRKVLDEDLPSIRRRHDPRALVFEPFERGADAARARRRSTAWRTSRATAARIASICATAPIRCASCAPSRRPCRRHASRCIGRRSRTSSSGS